MWTILISSNTTYIKLAIYPFEYYVLDTNVAILL
jgi:hypothetical protein